MSDLLKIAVEKWCNEVRTHDNWTWGNTCENLLRDINYTATSTITRENIRCTLNDGRPVELLRLEHGWGIRWGKDAVVPVKESV